MTTSIIAKNWNVGRATWSVLALLSVPLSGCSIMPVAGPSTGRIKAAEQQVANADIKIIDITDGVARQIIAAGNKDTLADNLGDGIPVGAIVGRGDVLDIAIWEAPPAALFGASIGGNSDLLASGNQTARGTTLPEQMVDSDGRISVPFVGEVQAAGRSPQQIGREIVSRLNGLAHQPQAVVRLVKNATKNVTIVGDVANSGRVQLTAKGERLLDVLAAAGGVRQSVNKMTIQVTRGTQVVSEPLETVITDPRQNIRLQPDDVVTAYYQPFSFSALGAVGNNNAEIPFEGTGITLAQALGRVGGLNDQRANASGVFIFRLENPSAVSPEIANGAHTTPDGKIPVIYRVNLKDPAMFFVAQGFPVKNKDVLYVSNAPIADLQKFVNIVSSVVIPAITVQNATRVN
ncbi:MAG: polysaccharide biosynthesis/export family protein [Sphingobium sp.]